MSHVQPLTPIVTHGRSAKSDAVAARESEVLRLTWAVIDGVASDEDRQRLGALIDRQYEARGDYVNAVRLDSELAELLNPHPLKSARRLLTLPGGGATHERGVAVPQMCPPIEYVRATG